MQQPPTKGLARLSHVAWHQNLCNTFHFCRLIKKKYDTFGFVYFKISIFMVQDSKHAFDYLGFQS
jgi:hypothetical protein